MAIITAPIQPGQGTATPLTVSQDTASRFPTRGTFTLLGLRIRCLRLIAKRLA